jgi:hypothetical protein
MGFQGSGPSVLLDTFAYRPDHSDTQSARLVGSALHGNFQLI